jgi:hypothetical protein
MGSKTKFCGTVDYFTDKHYVVMAGVQTLQGNYTRGKQTDIPELPFSICELLMEQSAERTQKGSTSYTYDMLTPEELAEVLSEVPAEDFDGDMERWARFAYACNYVTGGSGVEEFVIWAASSDAYASDSHVVRAQFLSGSDNQGSQVVTGLSMNV